MGMPNCPTNSANVSLLGPWMTPNLDNTPLHSAIYYRCILINLCYLFLNSEFLIIHGEVYCNVFQPLLNCGWPRFQLETLMEVECPLCHDQPQLHFAISILNLASVNPYWSRSRSFNVTLMNSHLGYLKTDPRMASMPVSMFVRYEYSVY